MLHEAGYLKVADFGLGKLLDASEATKQYLMTGETGSCKLLPPLQLCNYTFWVEFMTLLLYYVAAAELAD